MNFQRNFRYIVFAILLLAAGRSLYYILYNSKTNKATFDAVSHTYGVLETTNRTTALITDYESALRGYVISGNPVFLTDIPEEKQKLRDNVSQLKQLTADNPLQQANLARLEQLVKEKIRFQEDVLAAYQRSRDSALKLIAGLHGKNLSDSIYAITSKMDSHERALLKKRVDLNRWSSTKQGRFAIIGSIITMILLMVGAYFINKEISKRKNAQLKASANEEKYKSLISNSTLTVYSTSLDGVFNYASDQCYGLTGYTAEELEGEHYSILIRKDWFEKVHTFYVNQLYSGTYQTTLQFPITTKSGGEKWVEQNTVIISGGGGEYAGFQSFVKDITESKLNQDLLKAAEERLTQQRQENEVRLQAILNNIPMAVYIKDLEGRFIMINRQFRQTFGVNDDKVLGRKAHELTNNERDAKFYEDTDQQVIVTGKPVETEQLVVTAQGERNMLVTKFPLFDKDNKLFAISGVDKDITEMVRYREQLIAARIKAESAEKLQEEFLANMSHEIRTPMNGIVGMANLMADTKLDDEQKEFVSYIRYSSDILLALINDILDLSKIKAGRMTLEKTNFNLFKAIDSVFVPLQIKAAEKGLHTEKTLDKDLPEFITGDRFKLTQILNNLLSNAVKFTDQGNIKLTVNCKRNLEKGVEIEFLVEDTGIGIASDQLNSIFESFVQVGTDMVKRSGGTGLGLAITKKLVEMQGGWIIVSSDPGGGTCFRFTLQYETGAGIKDSVIPISGDEPGRELEGRRILLVEDNLVNQKVTYHMLTKSGMHVDIANDGKEAVQMLEQGLHTDLILLDLQMPEMDGFQVTAYIRNKLRLNMPIIAMTASVLRNEKLKCFQVGMNGYLSKPFAPEELFSHLHHFLNTNGLQHTVNHPVLITNTKYDLAYVKELEDPSYTAEVLGIFLETTPDAISDLKKHSLNENWKAVAQAAHKLKSSVGLLQMNTILTDLVKVEEYANKIENIDAIPAMVKNIASQYDLIRPMLEAEWSEARREVRS
jgi:PAS domain S-box-containing protein